MKLGRSDDPVASREHGAAVTDRYKYFILYAFAGIAFAVLIWGMVFVSETYR